MSAPIAQTEEDWEMFISSNSNQVLGSLNLDDNGNKEFSDDNIDYNLTDGSMVSYKSVEDLVHTFDERLASCFRLETEDNSDVDVGLKMPKVFDVAELKNNTIWQKLTDNYGLVQPLDWENSTVRRLQLPALKLQCVGLKKSSDNINEAELKKQLDFHRMVEYNIYTENIPSFYSSGVEGVPRMQTADEVIQEIEEMMKHANEADAAVDVEVQDTTGIIFDQENQIEKSDSCSSFEIYLPEEKEEIKNKVEQLESLSLAELNKLLDQVNDKIAFYSSQLLQDLGKRDEFRYEIETKKLFVSHVMEVQYAQESFHKENYGKGKLNEFKRSKTMDSISQIGLYLTTVIPYNKYLALNVEDLNILIKILEAIKNDSNEVPNLLASYILKVLCPPPTENELKL